jgi:serine/threonine protein kinase
MTSERQRQIEEIFQAALDRDAPSRAAFLAQACAGDEALRREVESLLAHHRTTEHFIETPAMEVTAKKLAAIAGSPVGRHIGPYHVLSLLGSGGMGEVYRARDPKLSRDVALKVLPELFAQDRDRLSRFKREAQVLAALNHPNIAAIYGFEDSGGVQALVLELVEGATLAHRIARGPILLDEALLIAKQIAGALEAAHEHGIIHRDLKPPNIKLRPDGAVKVLDFGLAKALDSTARGSDVSQSPTRTTSDATRTGIIMGTPAYMSPEHARGQTVDKRTDIWAFGCLLYELLAGRLSASRYQIRSSASSSASRIGRRCRPGRRRRSARCSSAAYGRMRVAVSETSATRSSRSKKLAASPRTQHRNGQDVPEAAAKQSGLWPFCRSPTPGAIHTWSISVKGSPRASFTACRNCPD